MIEFSVFFIRLFKKLIQLWGVDYQQFETLFRNSLTLDFRRTPVHRKSGKNQKNPFVKRLFVFVFIGVFLELSLFSIQDIMLELTILYSIIIVMLATSLLTEFTSVMFDKRENEILLVRPVNHRTLLMARIMHVQFYMGYIALAISLMPGILLAFKYHLLTAFAFYIGVGLSSWMTLLFTVFFYLMLSKVVQGNKFKDYVTYVQIFLGIVIFGGYQLLPQIADTDAMKQLHMSVHWWTYLIPPAWIAGFVNFFTFLHRAAMVYFFVLALAVPFLGAMVVVRFLSKGFGDILGSVAVSEKVQKEKKSLKDKFSGRMSRVFCVTKVEKLGWNFTMKIIRRDRKFKQAVYPMLGSIPVMAIMMLKPNFSDLAGSLHKMAGSGRYLFFIFFGFFRDHECYLSSLHRYTGSSLDI